MPPRLILLLRLRPQPLSLPPPPLRHSSRPRRAFFDLPNAPSQFSAVRTLPYPTRQLYELVADIDSYRHYLPYCLGSHVTARDPSSGAPTEANLRVGWGSFDETFRSYVHCVPDKLEVTADASQNPLFQTLVAHWRINELIEGEKGENEGASKVHLGIEFMFTNPVYGALSQAVAPKLAGVMIEAFEKRAKEVLGVGKKVLEGR